VSQLDLQRPEAFWKTVSGNGNTAVSVDVGDKAARFHDAATGKVSREIADGAYNQPIALSPAADKMVLADGTLMNLADRKKVFQIGLLGRAHPGVWFSADGRRLVAAVVA